MTQSVAPPGSVLVSGKSLLSLVVASCHLCLPWNSRAPPLPSSPPPPMNIFPAGPLQAHPSPTQLPHNPDIHSAPLGDQKFPKDSSPTSRSSPNPQPVVQGWNDLPHPPFSFASHHPHPHTLTFPATHNPLRLLPRPVCVVPPHLPRATPLPSDLGGKAPGLHPNPATY